MKNYQIVRNREIVRLYQEELMIMQDIGNFFDISKEAVRQILNKSIGKPDKRRAYQIVKKGRRQFNIWKKVDVKSSKECWLWNGAKCSKPYYYGHITVKGKQYYAHRYIWIMYNGDIPNGMCVCHKCDNPLCCNPEHLFLGTVADNMHDRDAKGRNNKGKKFPRNTIDLQRIGDKM